jgi:branched-chain amino acid transport system permease protein
MVEMVYHLSDVSGGTQMALAGVGFDARSGLPWLVFAALLAAGLVALRYASRFVGARWGTIQHDLLARGP